MTESKRFLDIDQIRVSKLEKLRSVESDLEATRVECELARDMLAKERDLSNALVDQNRSLLERITVVTESVEAEKAAVAASMERDRHVLEESAGSASSRVSELESQLKRSEDTCERLRGEMSNLSEAIQLLQVENKSLRAAASNRQADYSLHVDRLNQELTEVTASKTKVISDQRLMIDQLSNSMSEAATQLIETQNLSKYHQSDIEARDRKIGTLEERIFALEGVVSERDTSITTLTDDIGVLEGRLDAVTRDKEASAEECVRVRAELAEKSAQVQKLERFRDKSDLLQTNLVSELQSLPVINKRLESDCAFLRDDLKACAEKLRKTIIENDALAVRMKSIDSILSTEQRVRLNEKAVGVVVGGKVSESSAVAENKRLLIEAMELRMRLVDSQAARDRAQSHLIDQAQMIANLQKEMVKSGTPRVSPKRAREVENEEPNIAAAAAEEVQPRRLKARDSRLSQAVKEEEVECKQQ